MSDELPLYILRPGFDGLLADRWREFAQDNPDLFVELEVSRLSTDIEEELVQLHLDSECEGTGVGQIITQEDIRAIAERIVGLLTQPQKEQK